MGGLGSGHGSGGKRPGAGRPIGTTGPKCINMSIRVSEGEKAALRARAKAAGLSVTEYIKIKTLSGEG